MVPSRKRCFASARNLTNPLPGAAGTAGGRLSADAAVAGSRKVIPPFCGRIAVSGSAGCGHGAADAGDRCPAVVPQRLGD
jgi:hypothetical protein